MVWQDIVKIRTQIPLVHNITNYVIMNTTANALLAIGASPVMAHALEEVQEMTGLAQSAGIEYRNIKFSMGRSHDQGRQGSQQA